MRAAAIIAFLLPVGFALAPPPPVDAVRAYLAENAQSLTVSNASADLQVQRSGYSVTAGYETYADSGTNYDWAALVLLIGKWPVTDANVTVMLRWMRQENGPDNWFNRNNPMNNGWGSGGGGGTGTYKNLIAAAENAADALHSVPGYSGIVAELEDGDSADATARAIWASPWATSHYANGTHWSTREVPRVTAPREAWTG